MVWWNQIFVIILYNLHGSLFTNTYKPEAEYDPTIYVKFSKNFFGISSVRPTFFAYLAGIIQKPTIPKKIIQSRFIVTGCPDISLKVHQLHRLSSNIINSMSCHTFPFFDNQYFVTAYQFRLGLGCK